MNKGQIVFVRGHSLISKIINRIDGQYSHVAMALSNNTVLEAQRFTKSRIINSYYEDYDLVDITLTDEQKEKLLGASLELIGFDYDYKQVLYTLFNSLFGLPRLNTRSKYICSEVIINLLWKIGYCTQDELDSMIDATPNELFTFIECKERMKVNL